MISEFFIIIIEENDNIRKISKQFGGGENHTMYTAFWCDANWLLEMELGLEQ